jgi:hypothetical protein
MNKELTEITLIKDNDDTRFDKYAAVFLTSNGDNGNNGGPPQSELSISDEGCGKSLLCLAIVFAISLTVLFLIYLK